MFGDFCVIRFRYYCSDGAVGDPQSYRVPIKCHLIRGFPASYVLMMTPSDVDSHRTCQGVATEDSECGLAFPLFYCETDGAGKFCS